MAAPGFVPASERDVFIIGPPEQSGSKTDNKLSGEEARQFYEDLMREESSLCKQERRARRVRRRVRAVELQEQAQDEPPVQRHATGESQDNRGRETRSRELQGLRLLRCAQEGDISGLKELLSKGVDINFQVRVSFQIFPWKRSAFISRLKPSKRIICNPFLISCWLCYV